MRRYMILAVAATLVAAPAFASGSAQSSTSQPQSSTPKPLPPPTVDDATLMNFVKATEALRAVRKSYAPKVDAASSMTARNVVKQHERVEMRSAVVKYMPLSQYLQVEKEVRTDPKLMARAKAMLHEQSQAGGASSGSAANGTIDDATLQKFVKAAAAAKNVRSMYMPKYRAAPDASARAAVKKEERREAAKAIGQYMPVSQFMQIEKQMKTDPQLRARAKAMMKKHRMGASSASTSG